MQPVPQQLGPALLGDVSATRGIIELLTPVIQARAARALSRRGRGMGRDARQEVEDLCQDILCLLFRDDARVLRAWDPERGLSLLNYVGFVAEREIGHMLKSGRRSPWALDPTEDAELERASEVVEGPDGALASRDLLDKVYAQLEDELHPKAMALFRLFVVEEASVEDTCALTGLSVDSVYSWRSRLLRRARELIERLADSGAYKKAARIAPHATKSQKE